MKTLTPTSGENARRLLEDLNGRYLEAQSKNLSLNMSRGKPAPDQLDLSLPLLEGLKDYHLEDGTDGRNYGILEGIPECRRLFAGLLGLQPEQIILGGSSSLNLMFDTAAAFCLFGTGGEKPWHYYKYEGTPVKFICPVPGYDRHFTICEELGIEMIPVPLLEDGPDMEAVRTLAAEDPLVKGIWCVPLHSNPQGVCYSDAAVEALSSMETAAPDFRIFWDNAYGVHHIYEEVPLKNILESCASHGHPDRPCYFFSTSKITLAGAGVAMTASGPGNIRELKKHMAAQTISHDKLNQLRHVRFLKDPDNIRAHMKKLALHLRPKFDLVIRKLEEQLQSTGFADWSHPRGGYFISVNTLPECAARTVSLAREAGVTLTPAGAAFPYGRDPEDRNIRIAPSFPTLEELDQAMDIFILCVKIASLEKYLNNCERNERKI